jgi:crotonobetainyl-CoA:carnitine CoA-transferase CaiB-like acyl-CoA transferase
VLSVEELVDDEQFAARGAIIDAVTAPSDGTEPTRFRQVGPVLAGMPPAARPVVAGDPSRTDTDRLLQDAGLTAGHITELRDKGVVA